MSSDPSQPIGGILFDKDGTLIDFRETWDSWASDLIREATGSDVEAAQKLAAAMVYDLEAQQFLPDSPIIAGTSFEAAELVAKGLGREDVIAVETWIAQRASSASMAPVVPLDPLCAELRAAGLVLGVATNDAEAVAHANLAQLGVSHHFAYVAGFDSGFGGKPGPGMILAFCEAHQLLPEQCVMVGDSPHDLIAAQRAGVRPVAVLTGISTEQDLAPLAEVVLPDIGHLPDWIEQAKALR